MNVERENGTTFSGFVETSDIMPLQHEFLQFEEIESRGFNILLKAQREGKWFMLKGLKPEYRDVPVYLESLHKEYDVLLGLHHPGVVSVAGLEEVGIYGPCIIMEYVNGQNLRDALKQGLTYSNRLHIARQLIDILEYVHHKQIVHRDIKPSNIMLTDNDNYVKLIDFGCSDGNNYTFLKQPSGTESYMSPEQRTSSVPDIRNDIYSLGRVLEDLQLGGKYKKIIHKCKQPIADRYQSIDEVHKDFTKTDQKKTWGWIIAPILVLLALTALGIHYHWTERIYSYAKQIDLTSYDFVEDDIYYNILSSKDRTVEVTSNGNVNSYSGDITIPEYVEHNGIRYRVVRIGDDSFRQCDSLIAIVLPQSIHSIGNNAFMSARPLATIYLPDSISEMGDSVLRNADRLRSVHFPKSMKKVPPYCFSGGGSLRSLYLHEGIQSIERDALAGCNFDSITLPRTLKKIDRGVFWSCWRLRSVHIPANVDYIGDFVFWRCDSLRDVYVERRKPLLITNIFQDLKNVKLHVPHGSADDYRNIDGWKNLEIVEE